MSINSNVTSEADGSGHPADNALFHWGPLLRLTVVSMMTFCSMSVVTPTIKDLVRDRFSLDQQQVSFFMLMNSLPQILLLGLIVGLFSDRWGKRLPLAIIGSFGSGILTMLLPLPDTYQVLLGLRLVDGMLGIIGVGMIMTRALDLAAGPHRSRVMAIFTLSIPLGYLLGSLLVLLLGLLNSSVSTIYFIAGGALALSSLLLFRDLGHGEKVRAREPGLKAMGQSLGRMPRLWLPIFFGVIDKFSFALLATMPALVLNDRYQQGEYLVAGAVMTGFWIAFTLGGGPAGYLTNRLGAWNVVAIGSLGYGICLSLAVVFDSPWSFVAWIAIAGAFTALKFISNMVLISEMVRADDKATAMSAFNLFGSYGLLLGFIVTGILAKHYGYLVTFTTVGAMEIISAIIAFGIVWRMGKEAKATTLAGSPV